MNIKHLASLLILSACTLGAAAQTDGSSGGEDGGSEYKKVERLYRFRVSLKDKKANGYSVSRPQDFLSAKSIERRKRYGLKADERDLPLTPSYVKGLEKQGFKICTRSKWNNTVVVETADSALAARAVQLPYVRESRCVWVGPDSVPVAPGNLDRASYIEKDSVRRDTLSDYYGVAAEQVRQLNLQKLHEKGLWGEGITIAVLDGGFLNTDLVKGLGAACILGTRNFVRPSTSVYAELSHGTMVLSTIAANTPHAFVGTAPKASFYLLVSEDGESEQEIEEDYWTAALEYADSLGADIATSSLGYTQYDHEWMNRKYAALDGRTAFVSRTAALAASRGMLVVNSAGNSGMDSWKKIGVPGDAANILTVGAVDCDGLNTPFSSIGNTADGRIKPDVMAQGLAAAVYFPDGTAGCANGTSFSCPIMCGAAACLMQAFPSVRPEKLIDALRKSANNAQTPDNIYGYGIPDLEKAYKALGEKQ